MRPPIVYVPNRDFDDELLRSTLVKEILDAVARQGAELYRDGVPIDQGDLRDSIFGDVELTGDGYKGRIGATDWKAALVELGTSLRDPDASLRRALEALGFDLEETRRR